MSRVTIDFGIDLGTTNSALAVIDGTRAEVIRNNDNFEWTPSVIQLDKNNSLIIGRKAYEKLELDPGNTFCEFKLQMGSDHVYHFERDGREMTPVELSAEILKSLKADVQQRKGEDLVAAVISVPAAFELPQCDATRKAAEMAGLVFSPLVQEPVAAAMAYGFQDQSEKAFWLVYDFGGGTFDAAIIQVRDGLIQVVDHGGDNHLGGKLLDWSIVEQLLVPAVKEAHGLKDFRRGNPEWRTSFAKLKNAAEEAKKRASREKKAEILIDNLFQDDQGAPVAFEYTLQRADVESLMEPYATRSIDICRKVLKDNKLKSGDLEKVILVGGPTLTPYLRERLKDEQEGLGIPLEFGLDPLTVVAQGAAIFASTQRIEGVELPKPQEGQFAIELEYKPVGPDEDPMIGGRVTHPEGEPMEGYEIEFVDDERKTTWRSGRISLENGGVFTTELFAERGRVNVFKIELYDASGSQLEVVPDSLSYTVGQVITDPPLINSVGVALWNNEVQLFFKKGESLPVRKRVILRTAVMVRKGEGTLRIPVIEGDIPRADRNSLIGRVELKPEDVTRDIPQGSDVEFTIEIDTSRIVHTEAYLPILDKTVTTPLTLKTEKRDAGVLKESLAKEMARLKEVKDKARGAGVDEVDENLEEIERQNMVPEVEASLDAAEDDRDALDKAEKGLRAFQAKLDQAEAALEVPGLIALSDERIAWARNILNEYGEDADRNEFDRLEEEIREAIKSADYDLLAVKIEEVNALGFKLIFAQPGFWIGWFQSLEEKKSSMRDHALAEDLFARGYRAIQNSDIDTLKAICRQLNSLLPETDQGAPEGAFGSGVVR